LFGGSDKKGGSTVAPKPPGSEPPSGPSQPKQPDVKLPGGEEGLEKPGDVEDKPLKERRAKLSEQMMGSLSGKKTATGGGGGGDGPGGGGGPNQWGLTPNQLLLAVLA
jgi:AFG3 family protein